MLDELNRIFQGEIAGYSPDREEETFESLDLDSFDLVNLRAAIEAATGRTIEDTAWVECRRPSDVRKYLSKNGLRTAAALPSSRTRRYRIGMPQMAIGGLSENWLFKEIGDFHWSLIEAGLGVPSSQMFDGLGNRLYATFTRFRIESSAPWTAFEENEELAISGTLSRFGAGQFLGEFEGTASDKCFSATVLSSFSSRAADGSNSDLRKGQPIIPADCPIPTLAAKPDFIQEYQRMRSERANVPPAVFSRTYDINPYTDINGVGLLYFAAYPTIADFCKLTHFGDDWAKRASTVFRDVFYFANSDGDETLRYSLLSAEQDQSTLATQSALSREDGTPMAAIYTRKALVPTPRDARRTPHHARTS